MKCVEIHRDVQIQRCADKQWKGKRYRWDEENQQTYKDRDRCIDTVRGVKIQRCWEKEM